MAVVALLLSLTSVTVMAGPASAASGAPEAVPYCGVHNNGPGSILIAWDAPPPNGTPPITWYYIELTRNGSFHSEHYIEDVWTRVESFNFLPSGLYTARIWAWNGQWSEPSHICPGDHA